MRRRRLECPEEVNAIQKKWVNNNPEKVKENNRKKHLKEKAAPPEVQELRRGRKAKLQQIRRAKNPEKFNALSRRSYHANPRKANKRRATLAKTQYASDPSFKLAHLLRCRVRDALAGKSKKSAKTTELLGAPWVWVEAYLEEQFLPGMSWENHGPVWHIDHIRPCASFDLADPEQQKMCFHWSNLQPLFAVDNLRKSDKYDPQTP